LSDLQRKSTIHNRNIGIVNSQRILPFVAQRFVEPRKVLPAKTIMRSNLKRNEVKTDIGPLQPESDDTIPPAAIRARRKSCIAISGRFHGGCGKLKATIGLRPAAEPT
jgi:hypothetical protein